MALAPAAGGPTLGHPGPRSSVGRDERRLFSSTAGCVDASSAGCGAASRGPATGDGHIGDGHIGDVARSRSRRSPAADPPSGPVTKRRSPGRRAR